MRTKIKPIRTHRQDYFLGKKAPEFTEERN